MFVGRSTEHGFSDETELSRDPFRERNRVFVVPSLVNTGCFRGFLVPPSGLFLCSPTHRLFGGVLWNRGEISGTGLSFAPIIDQ